MAHGKSIEQRPPQIVAVRNGAGPAHYIRTSEPQATLCGEVKAWKVVRGKAAVAVCEACEKAKTGPVESEVSNDEGLE